MLSFLFLFLLVERATSGENCGSSITVNNGTSTLQGDDSSCTSGCKKACTVPLVTWNCVRAYKLVCDAGYYDSKIGNITCTCQFQNPCSCNTMSCAVRARVPKIMQPSILLILSPALFCRTPFPPETSLACHALWCVFLGWGWGVLRAYIYPRHYKNPFRRASTAARVQPFAAHLDLGAQQATPRAIHAPLELTAANTAPRTLQHASPAHRCVFFFFLAPPPPPHSHSLLLPTGHIQHSGQQLMQRLSCGLLLCQRLAICLPRR